MSARSSACWVAGQFSFTEAGVRTELERLMGADVVRVTDRDYMQTLQQRLARDHVTRQRQRIAQREADEVEREMDLVLKGEIPVEKAPKELADHPVLVNAQIIKKISEQKMPKRRRKATVVTRCFYPPAPPPGEEDEQRVQEEPQEAPQSGEEDVEVLAAPHDYLLSPDQYEKLKYESPLIKQLRQVETVQDLYRLADEIVGLSKDSTTAG